MKLRTATPDDLPAIAEVMRASMQSLGARFYDERQTASAVAYIAVADPQIVADGTYFVVEEEGEVIACGGWSKRKKLFSGPAEQDSDGSSEEGSSPASRLRMTDLLDPATEPARIRAMFVHPAHARRGLGRMIVDRAEAEARAAGFTRCELMATLPGVPLYRACGYEPVESVEIELPDGARLECVRMIRCVK